MREFKKKNTEKSKKTNNWKRPRAGQVNDLKELKLKGLPKRELEKWTKSGISEAQGRPDHAIKNHPFSPKTVNLKAAAVGNH